jgi:hypothetical protein
MPNHLILELDIDVLNAEILNPGPGVLYAEHEIANYKFYI